MELPIYLLDSAKRNRYFQALEKIPFVIVQLAEYDGVRIRDFLLTVREYTPSGLQLLANHFWLDKKELLAHVEQAAAIGCEIGIEGKTITIRRNLPDGKYFIAVYEPTEKAQS